MQWQPSGPYATQSAACYHQHPDTMTETGGECGQMGAVKNNMPFIPQCPGLAQSAAAEMRIENCYILCSHPLLLLNLA